MGGAGVLAFTKWSDVWQQPGREKYVVANGDESEPGTFKDRELMLRLPHLVVEGMIVAGLLTGAVGRLHLRSPRVLRTDSRTRRGNSPRRTAGDVRRGRARHRHRLPAPRRREPRRLHLRRTIGPDRSDGRSPVAAAEPAAGTRARNGLRDKPTAVNNVETLAWAPFIVLNGGKSTPRAVLLAQASACVPGTGECLCHRSASRDAGFFPSAATSIAPACSKFPSASRSANSSTIPQYCGGMH